VSTPDGQKRRFCPFGVSDTLFLSSSSAQQLVYFDHLPTISQHRITSFFVFPLSQSKLSSPYVAKRALTLFLFFQLDYEVFVRCDVNRLLVVINDKARFRTIWFLYMSDLCEIYGNGAGVSCFTKIGSNISCF
jgi:hypothetical protein